MHDVQSRPNHRRATATDAHVGLRIRAARLGCHMSQTDLATACGITSQQIQKYERGANRVAPGRLEQIAAALGRPILYFFERADGATSSTVAADLDPISQMAANPYGAEIIAGFLKLSHPRQQLLRDVITAICETLAED